jgi:hypothetical protein
MSIQTIFIGVLHYLVYIEVLKCHQDTAEKAWKTRHHLAKQRHQKRKQKTWDNRNKPAIVPFINFLSFQKVVDPKRFLVSELTKRRATITHCGCAFLFFRLTSLVFEKFPPQFDLPFCHAPHWHGGRRAVSHVVRYSAALRDAIEETRSRNSPPVSLKREK